MVLARGAGQGGAKSGRAPLGSVGTRQGPGRRPAWPRAPLQEGAVAHPPRPVLLTQQPQGGETGGFSTDTLTRGCPSRGPGSSCEEAGIWGLGSCLWAPSRSLGLGAPGPLLLFPGAPLLGCLFSVPPSGRKIKLIVPRALGPLLPHWAPLCPQGPGRLLPLGPDHAAPSSASSFLCQVAMYRQPPPGSSPRLGPLHPMTAVLSVS